MSQEKPILSNDNENPFHSHYFFFLLLLLIFLKLEGEIRFTTFISSVQLTEASTDMEEH